jgi:hypothetical protein
LRGIEGIAVKNAIVLLVLLCILFAAIFLGRQRSVRQMEPMQGLPGILGTIPSIGRIQILNGCGAGGAANKVGDFLRSKGFDVKNKGNAPTSNYPFTLVVSRKKDMTIARQVAGAIGAENDKILLMRNGDETYDVTVFVGSDYSERIK